MTKIRKSAVAALGALALAGGVVATSPDHANANTGVTCEGFSLTGWGAGDHELSPTVTVNGQLFESPVVHFTGDSTFVPFTKPVPAGQVQIVSSVTSPFSGRTYTAEFNGVCVQPPPPVPVTPVTPNVVPPVPKTHKPPKKHTPKRHKTPKKHKRVITCEFVLSHYSGQARKNMIRKHGISLNCGRPFNPPVAG
jgi:hypothetical protein